MQTKLKITGMTCGNCVNHVRQALLSVPGVTEAEVDLATGNATVSHVAADTASLMKRATKRRHKREPSSSRIQ